MITSDILYCCIVQIYDMRLQSPYLANLYHMGGEFPRSLQQRFVHDFNASSASTLLDIEVISESYFYFQNVVTY
jgi:hypothetical protein